MQRGEGEEVRADRFLFLAFVHQDVKHPNIVRLFDVIETDKYIGIILEFANGKDFFPSASIRRASSLNLSSFIRS